MSLATPFNILGEPLIELPLVESTNIYAMEQIKTGLAISGSAYSAAFQTRGKGQMGKFWESEKDKNILISYVLDWGGPILKDSFGLSVAVSLGLYHFIHEFAGDETSIKWPNDIYWRDRKAVGILIENSLRGNQIQWSVIGIGINVNQTSFETTNPQPVSLHQITGKVFENRTLIKKLSAAIQLQIQHYLMGNGKAQLTEYNQHLYRKNKTQKFKTGVRLFEASIQGVNQYGQLVLQTSMEECFNFGTIQWIQ